MLAFARRHGLFSTGGRALVAVSGGPDSSALLLVLARLREALSLDLTVAHFDHRLRSVEEREGDTAFVRGLADHLGVGFVQDSGDVRAYAKDQRLSLEEAGRRLRYRFLVEEAARLGAGAVAVGHTAGDQAETVLLHIVRGAGLDGLAGMRPLSPWPFGEGPSLARPLLCLHRRETERYCREVGIEPRQDPTNLLLEATRNRVRHQLLPALRELNPRIEEALLRLADAASADSRYLDDVAEGLWRSLAGEAEEEVSFPRKEFAGLAQALAARLLRRAVRHLLGRGADPVAVHVEAALAALVKRRSSASLPGGLTWAVDAAKVRLLKGEPKGSSPLPETPLAVPGRTVLPGWVIEAELVPRPESPVSRDPFVAFLDAEGAVLPLLVRSRRPGDRLRPLGLGGEKKVQDLLVDAHVPVQERDGVPLVFNAARPLPPELRLKPPYSAMKAIRTKSFLVL
ncbi:MAG: tRNA lysidine(34) synthetase TilS, partial [Chloroflexi bacterium]|nr:tRNA lysidine(34) synthetase TilS [Chloroflexota bacterium]